MAHRSLLSLSSLVLAAIAFTGCAQGPDEGEDGFTQSNAELNASERSTKYAQIRTLARAHGVDKTAYLLAGIAYSETGLAHCWSDAMWACRGPSSSDCGGGPVIAGAGDGRCELQQGGLGMFQFDAGTYADTLRRYGSEVLVMDGQLKLVVDYVVNMVKISTYTTDAETDTKALAWVNRFDVNNSTLRDQWVKSVTRYYNGTQPGSSRWNEQYRHYDEGLSQTLADTGGTAYWRGEDAAEASLDSN